MGKELTKKDLEHFAEALRRILERTSETSDRIEEESLDRGGSGLDLQGDAGSDGEFEEVDLDALDVEEGTAEAAHAALARITDGTYGRCTECGSAIARGRLEAVPYAPKCLSCQEAAEEEAG